MARFLIIVGLCGMALIAVRLYVLEATRARAAACGAAFSGAARCR